MGLSWGRPRVGAARISPNDVYTPVRGRRNNTPASSHPGRARPMHMRMPNIVNKPCLAGEFRNRVAYRTFFSVRLNN